MVKFPLEWNGGCSRFSFHPHLLANVKNNSYSGIVFYTRWQTFVLVAVSSRRKKNIL